MLVDRAAAYSVQRSLRGRLFSWVCRSLNVTGVLNTQTFDALLTSSRPVRNAHIYNVSKRMQ